MDKKIIAVLCKVQFKDEVNEIHAVIGVGNRKEVLKQFNDDEIFFYVENIKEVEDLKNYDNGEDFIVTKVCENIYEK